MKIKSSTAHNAGKLQHKQNGYDTRPSSARTGKPCISHETKVPQAFIEGGKGIEGFAS